MGLKRIGFFIAGIFFFVLGIIGLLLPVIPQVPFFLLSAYCFGKFSLRFQKWYTATWIYRFAMKFMKKDKEKDEGTK